ncbi:DUF4349 domain-containing protein [Allosphingosinicella indica]|uniref:DUF4349 domain-containing protein n=1 Tax=Allosphingosinicella indica TaxID=941907 RepID=A0A1X7G4Y3_9SPHN|nr:DUF4349 domain-containing protein [Allosphingosinicella indica]SMF64009.1 protein of unknown function [Allosphingosinicella indica]
MKHVLVLAVLFAAAACSHADEAGVVEQSDALPEQQAPPSEAQQEPPGAPAADAVAVQMPRIAYAYRFAFRLAPDRVAALQDRHLAMCDALGPMRCRVADLQRAAGEGEHTQGSLKLLVAADAARLFGDRLAAAADGAGGETVARAITAEDLSKQMVDTEARIRIKQALVDRLTALLATRSGNIQQAVEAERAVNAAQEELEQARAWLAEMRGRVALSTMDIAYQSGAPLAGGFATPVREAWGEVASLSGKSLAMILIVVAALAPWAAALALILVAVRLYRRRRPRAVSEADAE